MSVSMCNVCYLSKRQWPLLLVCVVWNDTAWSATTTVVLSYCIKKAEGPVDVSTLVFLQSESIFCL